MRIEDVKAVLRMRYSLACYLIKLPLFSTVALTHEPVYVAINTPDELGPLALSDLEKAPAVGGEPWLLSRRLALALFDS